MDLRTGETLQNQNLTLHTLNLTKNLVVSYVQIDDDDYMDDDYEEEYDDNDHDDDYDEDYDDGKLKENEGISR